jgi:hypothetical protein
LNGSPRIQESICLTVPGVLRYKTVRRRTKLCGNKILKTTTSQLHPDMVLLGVFFCT